MAEDSIAPTRVLFVSDASVVSVPVAFCCVFPESVRCESTNRVFPSSGPGEGKGFCTISTTVPLEVPDELPAPNDGAEEDDDEDEEESAGSEMFSGFVLGRVSCDLASLVSDAGVLAGGGFSEDRASCFRLLTERERMYDAAAADGDPTGLIGALDEDGLPVPWQ